jgi:Mycothiol maleylpyruvate isomerase N-terminal domain
MVAHLAGATAFCASIREGGRQTFAGRRLAKGAVQPLVDGINDVQIRERVERTPAELVGELRRTLPKAVHRRATYPRVLRRVRFSDPTVGAVSLGELMDVVYTRDAWMHRVDLARATKQPLQLTSDHDGRVVADVVRDWADRHGRPFLLELEGPAGGSYARGRGGEEHSLNAVEFCRILSGRRTGSGLLATRVLF